MIRYYITDRKQLREPLACAIERAMLSGIDMVQIREKDLTARALQDLVSSVLRLPNPKNTRVLVNDRADIALACDADGVHLPANSIPPRMLRRMVPADFLIGVSCHSVDEAVRAEDEGASFVVLGPIFPTPSKPAPLGTAILSEAAARLRIPVIALGGVAAGNIEVCMEAGAAGVAGIRLFQQ